MLIIVSLFFGLLPGMNFAAIDTQATELSDLGLSDVTLKNVYDDNFNVITLTTAVSDLTASCFPSVS